MLPSFLKGLIKAVIIVVFAIVTTACGSDGSLAEGGTTDEGTGGNVDVSQLSVRAFLVSTSTLPSEYDSITSNTISLISDAQPGRLIVKLSSADGIAIADEIIDFSLDDKSQGLLSFSKSNGSALTNADGFADVDLAATDLSGAGQIIVSYNNEEIARVAFQSDGGGTGSDSGEEPLEIGSVELLVDAFQMPSSGAQTVNLIALVKDNNNNLVSDAKVAFSATSGGIEVINATTGSNGVAEAKLQTKSAPATRIITVTASVADQQASADVLVTGSSVKISGNDSFVVGSQVTLSAVVLDSDGKGLANQTVLLSSENGNTLNGLDNNALPVDEVTSTPYVATDASGSVSFKYIANTSGNDVLTASALGELDEFDITVSADNFSMSSLEVNGQAATNNEVPMVQGGLVKLVWQKDGAAHQGDVLFSITRGQIFEKGADTAVDAPLTTSLSTDSTTGELEVLLVSADAGPALVTAKAEGLSTSYEIEFVAETAHMITLQASPFSIGPNGQQSTISAVVRDKDGNLVKNRPVNFQLFDVSGGEIFPATNVTDSNGLATSVYTSNTVSGNGGVVVAACTDTQGDASACAVTRETNDNTNSLDDTYGCIVTDKECVFDSVHLTVAEREVLITAGLGNALEEPTPQEYQFDIPVYVTDVNSNPMEGIELSISAIPTHYAKGSWIQQLDVDGQFEKWIVDRTATCLNEDIDRDGVLDVEVNGVGFNEDRNGNGVLDPGNVVRTSGNFVTDSNGATMISIIYPQSYGGWIDLEFVINAKVVGTEHIRTLKFSLPVLQDDVTDEKFAPITAGFGTGNLCTDSN